MIRSLLIIGFLASCLTYSGCSEEDKNSVPVRPEIPPLPVEVITVENEQVPIWIEFSGKTEAAQKVEVTARVAGQLEQVLFQEGEYVSEGDTLFVIEKDKYEASLAQAKAQLQRDKATLELARKDVERYRPLVAEDLAPRATLEQYEARAQELAAMIGADEATIREAELNLSYTDVKAPISGRIGRSRIDVGNVVGYGSPTVLATIVADDPLYAYFNPPERSVQIMEKFKSSDRMAAKVMIKEDSEGLLARKPLSGEVSFSDNRVDPMTGTITMRAEVANPDRTILEGTFVYVEVMVTDEKSFMLIPPGIVMADQQGDYVYVVNEDKSVKRADIVLGYESRHYVVVLEGLEGGEQLVASGLAKVRPGTVIAATDVTESKGSLAVLKKQGMYTGKE